MFEPLGMGEKNLKKTAQISDFVPLYIVSVPKLQPITGVEFILGTNYC